MAARETRYFAGSLDPATGAAAGLLALVRGHRGVEDGLDFVKDRCGDEDRHDLSRPGWAARCALGTGAALAVPRRTRADPRQPLRARADELSHDVEQAINIIREHML